MNAGLLTRLINTEPDEVRILYGSAYSIIPGLVHIRDFQLRIQDSNIQMEINLKKVRVLVNVFTLFNRKFSAKSVHGEGVSFRFRFRREAPLSLTSTISTLPKIDGLPSIFKNAIADDNGISNPWKIHIEGISLNDLNEVWFEEFHYNGNIAVEGAFYLYPKHLVEIFYAKLKVQSGVLQIGKNSFLKSVSGKIEAQIKSFDPGKALGLAIFRNISAEIELATQMQGLQFLNYYLINTPSIRFGEGSAVGNLKMAIKNGVVQAGSDLSINAEKLTAKLWHHNADGRGSVKWQIKNENLNELILKLQDFALKPEGSSNGIIEGPTLQLTAFSTGADLTEALPNLNISLKIPKANLTDLRYLNSYFPKSSPFEFQNGKAKLAVEIDIKADEIAKDTGIIRLSASGVSLKYRERSLSFDMDSQLSFKDSSVERGSFNLGTTSVSVVTEQFEKWNGKLEIQNGKIEVVDKASELNLDLTLSGKDARPLLFLIGITRANLLSGSLTFPSFHANANLKLNEAEMDLSQIQVSGENRSLVGWWRVKNAQENGRFLFQYGPLAVGIELSPLQSRLRLQEAVSWYEKNQSSSPMPAY